MNYLDKLRDLDAKATPGPWHVHNIPFGPVWVCQSRPPADETQDAPIIARFGIDKRRPEAESTAESIVTLRNSTAQLAAVIEAARAHLDAYEGDDVHEIYEIAANDAAYARMRNADKALKTALDALDASVNGPAREGA